MNKHSPVDISGAEVEQVSSYRFLGITIAHQLHGARFIINTLQNTLSCCCLCEKDSNSVVFCFFFTTLVL